VTNRERGQWWKGRGSVDKFIIEELEPYDA